MTQVQVFRWPIDYRRHTLAPIIGCLIMLAAFALTWHLSEYEKLLSRLWQGVMPGVCALAWFIAIVVSQSFYLKLEPDRLGWRIFTKVRHLHRTDILGWGIKTFLDVPYIEVRMLAGERMWFPVPASNGAQPALERWLTGLPELDATDDVFFDRALLSNPAFGAPEMNSAHIHNHKVFLVLLSSASAILAFWTLLSGYAPVRVIAVVSPVLVCIMPLLSGGRWSLTGRPRSTLPVWHIALWPVITTVMVASYKFDPVNEAKVWLSALAAGGALWVLQKFVDRRTVTGLFLPVSTLYAFAALSLVNGAYQVAPPQFYQTTVRSWTGMGGRTSGVVVEPWGPVIQLRALSMDRRSSLQEGDALCMTLYTGALGWQYYDYALCEPKAPPAAP